MYISECDDHSVSVSFYFLVSFLNLIINLIGAFVFPSLDFKLHIAIQFPSSMHLKELASFFLIAAPLLLASPIASRDDPQRDEAVFLTTCDLYMKSNDATPNGSKDQLFYFRDYNKSLQPTSSLQDDDAFSNNPGDKSHPVDWTSGTVETPIKGQLDKRTFTAWDLEEQAPDSETHTTGRAMLGSVPMRCYDNANATWKQDYGEKMYVKCRAKYYCTREERQIRRVVFNVYNTTEKVVFDGHESDYEHDREVANVVRSAFSSLQSHYLKGEINRDKFPIGKSEHLMEYYVHREEKAGDPFWESDRIQLIQEHLLNYVVPAIKKTEKIDCKLKFYSPIFLSRED